MLMKCVFAVLHYLPLVEAEDFSTALMENYRKEGGEVQERRTDKSHFHSRTLLSPQILQQAITKQILIKLGFVTGYN